MSESAAGWQQQRERSTGFMLWLLVSIALHLGRPIARLILLPTVLYFLLTGSAQRRASRQYLARVLGRTPGWRDLARHFHSFASCALDRVFLIAGRTRGLKPRVTRLGRSSEWIESRRGSLVLLSHIGSFDVIRVPGAMQKKLPLRVVMDRAQGRMLTSLLERLQPELASVVLDASQGGPTLVLRIKEALDAGQMVCLMADRVREGEASVEVDFLGGRARLPAAPWIIAGTLGVPVMLGIGLYRGGGEYEATIEEICERVQLDRRGRMAAVAHHAQAYAQRLEHYAREAPYNWFNFYDYWIHDAAAH